MKGRPGLGDSAGPKAVLDDAGAQRVELDDAVAPSPHEGVLSFNAALERLADSKPEHATLIELRYLGGMTRD
jgi:hypothetical protein